MKELSNTVKQQIDKWVAKYPTDQKQSAVLPALTIVQEQNDNCLTEELMNAVADYLQMPHVAVYEVATFYNMYNLKPVGKHIINVCTNISCMLRGSDIIADHLKRRLNVEFGETTADKKFTLREVECLGACVGAPMLEVNKKFHEYLTPIKIDEIIEELAND